MDTDWSAFWRGARAAGFKTAAAISEALEGEHVGLEETDYGVWSVYFGPTLLGILDEQEGRILG